MGILYNTNMIKALLVDADGIVLKKRNKYFTDRLREDGYDLQQEKEKEFFKNVYPDIRIGKKDLEEEVGKYLTSWNWDKSASALLEYWFSYENQLDQEVIDNLQELRQKGIKIYLASDHSKYRAKDLWENVGLKEYFDGHFFSCNLGTTKAKPDFYTNVLEELGLHPNEVAFFDDEEENIEVAKKAGIKAQVYKSVDDLKTIPI